MGGVEELAATGRRALVLHGALCMELGMIRIGSRMQTREAQSRRGTRFAQELAGGRSSQMLAKNLAVLYLCPANLRKAKLKSNDLMCFFLLPIVYACVCVYGVLRVVYAHTLCAGVHVLWVCGESEKDVGCPALMHSLTRMLSNPISHQSGEI